MTNNVRKITLSALFLAIGLILPMAFHSFGPNAGMMFLPMHIPVLLCGFICGPTYGVLIGIMTPLLSSALTGMPPIMPTGIAMVCELMTYGLLSGLLLKRCNVYISLLVTMVAGRVVSGVMNLILLSVLGKSYTFAIFITGAFVTAIPGIVLQIMVVPLLVKVVVVLKNKHPED